MSLILRYQQGGTAFNTQFYNRHNVLDLPGGLAFSANIPLKHTKKEDLTLTPYLGAGATHGLGGVDLTYRRDNRYGLDPYATASLGMAGGQQGIGVQGGLNFGSNSDFLRKKAKHSFSVEPYAGLSVVQDAPYVNKYHTQPLLLEPNISTPYQIATAKGDNFGKAPTSAWFVQPNVGTNLRYNFNHNKWKAFLQAGFNMNFGRPVEFAGSRYGLSNPYTGNDSFDMDDNIGYYPTVNFKAGISRSIK